MRRCGALNKTSVERRACCVRATYALTVPTAVPGHADRRRPDSQTEINWIAPRSVRRVCSA